MRADLQKALLQREMTRKEFLQFLGSSLIILLGLPSFLQLLQRTANPKSHAKDDTRNGFGSRKFGA